ncbi:MAG: sensor histidine kinase [Anaerolineaceae bacterium]|nr:sensor histidine kinase [Anaerolineaceae bacterium]
MKQKITPSYEWVYYLTVLLFFLTVMLRTLISYNQIPDELGRDLAILVAFLFLLFTEPAITRRWQPFFFVYLLVQMSFISLLMLGSGATDYFAILFSLLSMRIFQRLTSRPGSICLGVFTLLIFLILYRNNGPLNTLAFALVYTAANALTALFSLNTRLASEAHHRNQAMQGELQSSNFQIQLYSEQAKRLAIVRERNRLARELHDSVTQTVFSMTLTTQSALLLLDRDPSQLRTQLNHLSELAKSALAETQDLITQLAPQGKEDRIGLVTQLRQHLNERLIPEGLSISVKMEGNQALAPEIQQALFRICQEAVNNIVKHAHASQACLNLHLTDPLWIEIEDNGQGFQLEQIGKQGGIGLSTMRERAVEIGWDLEILTSSRTGTRIRVEKREVINDRRD